MQPKHRSFDAIDPLLSHQLFDEALRTVRQHLDMPISYLSKFEGDSIRFLNVSTDLEKPFLTTGTITSAEGTYCKAVKDGLLPELLPDTSQNAYARSLAITHAAPVGAVVSIPILAPDGSIFGMFCCLSHDPKPELTQRDHAVMAAYGRLVTDIVHDATQGERRLGDMRRAIASLINERTFEIVVQPIVELTTGKTVSAEALSRFHIAPYRSPDKWFAEAAECGMGEDLELTMFTEALAVLAAVDQDVSVSVNLSPQALRSDALWAMIAGRDIAHKRLIIELTEHATFHDQTGLRKRIARLRALGVRIALDDLGTGYSSLSAVLDLRPDIVKLDRSLITRLTQDPASRSLSEAITKFASDINATVVAEGVETKDQADMLRSIGVELGQGYFFARPDRCENLPLMTQVA